MLLNLLRKIKFIIMTISRFIRRLFYNGPTYSDLLKRPEWKEKRKAILNRDGHKCVHCGSTNKLQVHHTYYSNTVTGKKLMPWDYPDDALITLCSHCHLKEHSKGYPKIKVRLSNGKDI